MSQTTEVDPGERINTATYPAEVLLEVAAEHGTEAELTDILIDAAIRLGIVE